jgi:hypothetical protein
MKASWGLFMIAVAIMWGFLHGILVRRFLAGRNAGVYVKRDEYRVGAYSLSVVFSFETFRILQSYWEYGKGLREGFWPVVWTIVYCWGITAGYGHGRNLTGAIPITEIPDE